MNKNAWLSAVLAVTFSAFIGGCASTSATPPALGLGIELVEPLPVDYRSELAIAKLTEILYRTELNENQQAQLFYDRGVLYDSVGLHTLARIDFNRTIKLKRDMPEVYNFLGVHHTLAQEFSKAYEMFDSVLDLDPKHEYAYLNRGIALYYGKREELASQDLAEFLNRAPTDPYRVLWLYISESALSVADAKEKLQGRQQQLDKSNWAYQIVQVYAGELSEKAFIANINRGVESQKQLAERLCEAYFYLAKMHLQQGKNQLAIDYFHLALATNVKEFVEYKYARLELELLRAESLQALEYANAS